MVRVGILLAGVLFWLTSVANEARAGAWMRAAGDTFLSFGADIDTNGTVTTFFAETGIGPKLMLGLDAWHSPFGDWSVLAVATRPLLQGDQNRASVSLGFGMARASGREGPQARLALHLGRGLKTGWLASDIMVTHRFFDEQASAKATATWGHNLSDRCAAIFEVRAETRVPISVAPSMACYVGKSLRIRLGGAQAVTRQGGPTVFSVQTWLTF